MLKLVRILIGVLAVALGTVATAAEPVTLAATERFEVKSSHVKQTFLIDVAMPMVPSDAPLPVLYVLDGNLMLPLVANTVRLLQLGGELPPLLVVGIGYPVSNSSEILALRTRDLTPTASPEFVKQAEAQGQPLPPGIAPGGAEAFRQFIEQELKPLIRDKYATAPDETLVGDSFGGLFALYSLFTAPDAYDRYLVGSPSIWWDGSWLFAREKTFAEEVEDVRARVFLSVGLLEESENDPAQMVTNTKRMIDQLQSHQWPNLRLSSYLFDGETHLSVIPATFSRGLRELFAP